jgi:D-sedoheptulose 7-phosphate isomerase
MGVDAKAFLDDYLGRLKPALAPGPEFVEKIVATRTLWLDCRERGGRVLFMGNGGSSGIASHLAIDLAKNAKVPALCFSDAAQITCLANDYGFENWMARALTVTATKNDVLVIISSSGRSRNVLNAAATAKEMGIGIVTLSGMAADNPLRAMGEINFWFDSRAYNVIETVHQLWMMSVIDLIIGKAEYSAS